MEAPPAERPLTACLQIVGGAWTPSVIGGHETMYNHPAFREQDLSRRHPLIRDHPLGILISATVTGLRASPLPFVLETTGAPFGVLRGHLTRADDHGQALEGAATRVTKFLEGGEGYVDIAG